jgi:hypothetical protein
MENINLMSLFIGLCIGNFLFQLVIGQDFMKAFDRSWFQGAALVAVWICSK